MAVSTFVPENYDSQAGVPGTSSSVFLTVFVASLGRIALDTSGDKRDNSTIRQRGFCSNIN